MVQLASYQNLNLVYQFCPLVNAFCPSRAFRFATYPYDTCMHAYTRTRSHNIDVCSTKEIDGDI